LTRSRTRFELQITVGRGEQLRVIAIDDFPHAELVEHDVRAIFTVEPM
jgi:hypothetical protein